MPSAESIRLAGSGGDANRPRSVSQLSTLSTLCVIYMRCNVTMLFACLIMGMLASECRRERNGEAASLRNQVIGRKRVTSSERFLPFAETLTKPRVTRPRPRPRSQFSKSWQRSRPQARFQVCNECQKLQILRSEITLHTDAKGNVEIRYFEPRFEIYG